MQAEFQWEIPVAELPGISNEVSTSTGFVDTQVRFGKEQGLTVAWLTIRAPLRLVCQRCMGPMELALDASSVVALVASERDADAVSPEWETYLAPDGRLIVAALVAEELLLGVPLVPLHAQGLECGAPPAAGSAAAYTGGHPAGEAGSLQDDATSQVTVRPFASLRALLDGGGESD